MGVPRVKKPKRGTLTYKEHIKACEDAMKIVQTLMIAAMQDELHIDGKQIIKVMETSALYAKHYDNHALKLKEISEIVYKQSDGEIDIRLVRS